MRHPYRADCFAQSSLRELGAGGVVGPVDREHRLPKAGVRYRKWTAMATMTTATMTVKVN